MASPPTRETRSPIVSDATKPPQITPPRPASPPAIVWLLLALAFLASFWLIRRNAARTGAPATGGRANYAWTATGLDGQPVPFKNYAGRAVFLNVWATWCGPCVTEMPSIARLAANPRLKDVAFVCVATDDSIEPVRRFAERLQAPMTIVHAGGEIPPVFRSDSIPATYILAPDGRIVYTETRGRDWDDAEIVALLERLARHVK